MAVQRRRVHGKVLLPLCLSLLGEVLDDRILGVEENYVNVVSKERTKWERTIMVWYSAILHTIMIYDAARALIQSNCASACGATKGL
ncbi:hypothetical protein BDR03DRAFT_954312 [Suillus americanus]|nr:hypothetical protein BDR03DRAFT_954312 [Suillus americanus]